MAPTPLADAPDLLRSVSITAAEVPDRLSELALTGQARDALWSALETISVLGEESAGTLVKMALGDHGFGLADFAASGGGHERAARLWLTDQDHAKQVLRWWFANSRLWRREKIESFRTAPCTPPTALDNDQRFRLQGLLEATLAECLQSGELKEFHVGLRPCPWPGQEGAQVLQIDLA